MEHWPKVAQRTIRNLGIQSRLDESLNKGRLLLNAQWSRDGGVILSPIRDIAIFDGLSIHI